MSTLRKNVLSPFRDHLLRKACVQLALLLVVHATGCRTVNRVEDRDCSKTALVSEQDASLRQPLSVPPMSVESEDVNLEPIAWQAQPPSRTGEDEPAELPEMPLQPEPEQLPTPDAQDGIRSQLTIEQVGQMALSQNPAIRERAAAVEAARGTLIQVGLKPNPRIGYTSTDIGLEGSPGRHGMFVSQQFVTGNKLELNRRVAAWQVERAQREFESLRLRVLTDVRIAFYEALIAQRRNSLAEELVEVSQKALEAAQSLFEGKEVSRADPLRARIEADAARITLENARTKRLETWRRLAVLINAPKDEPARLAGEPDAGSLDIDWDQTLERILSENPQIAAALANVESARWIVEREIAAVRPNVSVMAVIQHDEISGDSVAGVQVQFPLPIYNRNQGAIQRAQFDVATAAHAADRLALNFESRLTAVFQKYSSAKYQVQQYSREGGIIDNAERSLELLRAGYQAGEFGLLDFLAAQRTYFQTNLAYLNSQQTLWTSVEEIRGLLLKNSLGSRTR